MEESDLLEQIGREEDKCRAFLGDDAVLSRYRSL